ncbi:MAG TPA: hypothetical protein VKQ11_06620 [Candidatus Sulfotelmatobacter sp.]|nr:hypothetical protein [Candidatus Sulfotelmatobacter sp.]
MKNTQLFVAALMCLVVPISMFASDASNGYKVTYDGGSLSDTKAGTGLRLVIGGDHVTFLHEQTEVLNIPASSITEVSYGQTCIGALEQLSGWQ